jgi:hypothetical protein
MRPFVPLAAPLLAACLAASAVVAQSNAPLRPMLEASVWGGYTAFTGASSASTGGRTSDGGLRSIEVAAWPSAAFRLFARYENSLSLDNLALIRANRRVPTYRGGALINWGGRFTTVVDVGRRTLPAHVSQTMLGAEQVLYLPNGTALKAGGWVGPRNDQRTEWLAHAGVNLAAGSRVRLEPTVFFARSGIGSEQQWRALLAGEARLSDRVTLGAGVAAGRNRSIDPRLTGTSSDAYLRCSASLGGLQAVHVLLRHESAPGASDLTTIAAGISLGVPRP